MLLTKHETEALEGKFGRPVQKSMEILLGLGECYEAERMISVTSTHILASPGIILKGGIQYMQELADMGGKFVTFTTTNPSAIDPRLYNNTEIGISEESFSEQMGLTKALVQMGVFLSNTCTPFLVGHVPRFGQHIAWSESSAVVFANSVLGARTNREGAPGSIAAALTGKVPAYGYHLDQNRYGELEISVNTELNHFHDYGTLGWFVGKVAGDRVPVLTGITPSVSWDELKLLGAAAATSGGVALYHVVGVTPEAPTKEAAFGNNMSKDWPRFEFREKQLRETEESISKANEKEVQLVVLGCPHASIAEIRDIARLLSNKKLRPGVQLWISTPRIITTYAENMGYIKKIEESGARVISDVCPLAVSKELLYKYGPRVAATNSAKLAHYMAPIQGRFLHYGSIERCVEAAISGMWR
ncbi:aconitase X [Candidatus Omnitrophota bacterium]